jgi:hypothetical protein
VLRIAAFTLATLWLAGCGQSYVYVRADGQDISGAPALYKQFEGDSMICHGETHRQESSSGWGPNVGANSGAVNDCMTAKGYVVVPSEMADLKRRDLAARAANTSEAAARGVGIEKLAPTGAPAALRAAPVPLAAGASPVLERCSRISDKAARLECFDRATTKNSDSRR